MRYALYFIPPAGSFYMAGSVIVGYDIRGGYRLDDPPWRDPAWTARSRQYGFHVTIADAVTIDPTDLPRVERAAETVLSCFASGAYTLSMPPHPLEAWGSRGETITLRLEACVRLAMLHTALVYAVQTLGSGSEYTVAFAAGTDAASLPLHQLAKIRHLHSPYVLDDFRPHFTLLNPFTGPDRTAIMDRIAMDLSDEGYLPVTSLCLVTQSDPTAPFVIAREYSLV